MKTKEQLKKGEICDACKKGSCLSCAYTVGNGYGRTRCQHNCNFPVELKSDEFWKEK